MGDSYIDKHNNACTVENVCGLQNASNLRCHLLGALLFRMPV